MRPALYTKFVAKAEAALVAAVDVYNKPTFLYREETFALLATNACELLLKARLLKENGNDLKAIRVYELRQTKSGKASKKRYLKKNRAGSPMTLSFGACIAQLDKAADTRLTAAVKQNLDALVAIRDGAAHYINPSPVLVRKVLEVACATVKNFVLATREWFGSDLSGSLPFMLPLAFLDGERTIESVVVTAGERGLLKYLEGLTTAEAEADPKYAVALKVDVQGQWSVP